MMIFVDLALALLAAGPVNSGVADFATAFPEWQALELKADEWERLVRSDEAQAAFAIVQRLCEEQQSPFEVDTGPRFVPIPLYTSRPGDFALIPPHEPGDHRIALVVPEAAWRSEEGTWESRLRWSTFERWKGRTK